MAKNIYSAQSIKVFKGLDAVRKRPGMYIGNVNDSTGLHQMVYEVIDNSIDEVLAGHAKNVWVTLYSDDSVGVKDDGRGIPVDMHEEEQMSAAEVIMTKLHAGGKFDSDSYKISGGLHGVGVSVVNALSHWLELYICRNKKQYCAKFKEGSVKESLHVIKENEKITGTEVKFLPSKDIFSVTKFDFSILKDRLSELAFLNRGISISLCDQRNVQENSIDLTFKYDGGIEEYVKHLNKNKTSISPIVFLHDEGTASEVMVEIAMQWNDSYHENLVCFTNNIRQKDGGTHLFGLKTGITKAFSNYFSSYSIMKKNDIPITGEDIREGLTCIVSVKLSEPTFSSQTKDKLVSEKVKGAVDKIVANKLFIWLEKNSSEAKVIIEKIKEAAHARVASRKARELVRKKNALSEFSILPGKLADCQEKNPVLTEIFIVEGDSAGGTTKQGRERKYQAVLPIRGKILNVEKARFDKIFSSEQIKILISALGTGIGKHDFDVSKIRYNKVIIMTDADVDGAHIRTLLLTFFFRHMPEVIEKGYLYIAQPPLYQIKNFKNHLVYIRDEQELQKYLIEYGIENYNIKTNEEVIPSSEKRKIIKQCYKFTNNVVKLGVPIEIAEKLCCLLANINFIESEQKGATEPEEKKIEKIVSLFNSSEIDLKQEGWKATLDENSSHIVFVKLYHNQMQKCFVDIKELMFGQIKSLTNTHKDILVLFENNIALDMTNENIFKNIHTPVHLVSSIIKDARSKLKHIQRFKGLGEMNANQLKETTLDPQFRTLIKVTVEDAFKADNIFSVLMGDAVDPRKSFIQNNALNVCNLDY